LNKSIAKDTSARGDDTSVARHPLERSKSLFGTIRERSTRTKKGPPLVSPRAKQAQLRDKWTKSSTFSQRVRPAPEGQQRWRGRRVVDSDEDSDYDISPREAAARLVSSSLDIDSARKEKGSKALYGSPNKREWAQRVAYGAAVDEHGGGWEDNLAVPNPERGYRRSGAVWEHEEAEMQTKRSLSDSLFQDVGDLRRASQKEKKLQVLRKTKGNVAAWYQPNVDISWGFDKLLEDEKHGSGVNSAFEPGKRLLDLLGS